MNQPSTSMMSRPTGYDSRNSRRPRSTVRPIIEPNTGEYFLDQLFCETTYHPGSGESSARQSVPPNRNEEVSQPSTNTGNNTANNKLRENCKELICTFCKKYLSMPPIFIGDNGKTNVCGRCEGQSVDTTLLRNETYEKLAKTMEFPCSESKNCTEVLTWGRVSEHEKICPFRVIKCPHSNCSLPYESNNLLNHFRSNHKVYVGHIVNHNFVLKPDVILIEANDCLFLAFMTTDSDFICINIVTFNVQQIKHKFAIGFNSKNCSIDYSAGHSIGLYSDNLFSQVAFIRDNTVRFKKQSIDDILMTSSSLCGINIKLEIFEANKFKTSQLTYTISCCTDIVIKALECPICFGTMDSYIFVCRTGHSICASCKQKVTRCPTCKEHFRNCRNYALEALYQKIQLISHVSPTDLFHDDYLCN